MPIVTLTLNPAIDVASEVNGVRPNHKTRTVNERIDPGGGGINVANVMQRLGGDVLAVILAGGVTGRYLQELLDEEGLHWQVVPIAGRIRMCTTVLDRVDGTEYRFVPEGPVVSEAEWRSALAALEQLPWSWLVASGSLPRGVPVEFYRFVADLAARRGARLVLDTSGPALKASLGSGLALIKPSLSELEYLTGRQLPGRDAQAAAALRLVQDGAAAMVAVTVGGEGAMLASAAGVVWVPGLDVPVRSTVGAGDGFLAAMVLALTRGESPEAALAWGVAAGAAVASVDGTVNVSPDMVKRLFSQAERILVHMRQPAAHSGASTGAAGALHKALT